MRCILNGSQSVNAPAAIGEQTRKQISPISPKCIATKYPNMPKTKYKLAINSGSNRVIFELSLIQPGLVKTRKLLKLLDLHQSFQVIANPQLSHFQNTIYYVSQLIVLSQSTPIFTKFCTYIGW